MTASLLATRFPVVAAAVEAAGACAAVAWRAGPTPALAVDGVQLESRFDAPAEAELQARLVPDGARTATVYGTAQGTLILRLLARAELARLRVVVLNPQVLGALLARVPAPWLDDARLALELAREGEELATPFVALPAELRLARGAGQRLADLARLELATPFVRRRLQASEPELALRRATNAERFGADPEVAALFGTRRDAQLCVAAAGPTLALHYDELRARAHELVAVDAALKPLLAADIVPAFVVTQDAHEEGMRRVFAVAHARLAGSTLVWFPQVFPGVMERWPGARRQAGALWSSGSVVHPAVDLAVRLGARRVELFGADFALCGGRSHVAGAAWERAVEVDEAGAFVLDAAGARVPSLPNLVGYLRDLERYVARHPEIDFVQRSRAGAAIRGARTPEVERVA